MKIKPIFVLVFALLLGLFMRGFQFQERFLYAHDSDLASWIVKDIVVDHHLRLIGQLTSVPGIFIGPLFYYLLIPFYLIGRMDPLPSVFFSILVGLTGIASIYYVFKKTLGLVPAQIGAILYAVSFGISQTEREVVPTTPVMLWTVWFFYAVHKKNLILTAVLLALIWHLNLALFLLAPLLLIPIISKKFSVKELIVPVIVFLVLSLPLFVFEARHGFTQTHALTSSLFSVGGSHPDYLSKFLRTILLASRNINQIFWDKPNNISIYFLPLIFLGLLIWRKSKTLIPWVGLYLVFFTFHPIILSEYYLNGLNIVWLALASQFLARLKILGVALLLLVISFNVFRFLHADINRSGYTEKKAIVAYIAQDAAKHKYPCVAVSYMTDAGYNFGYRYFFWLAKLHVNQPKSNSPVYTIVFPHSRANQLDKTFGALGLIFPDYSRYTKAQISESCAGLDANLTDPMFGFTK